MVKGRFTELERKVGNVILPSALRDGDAEDGARGLGTGGYPCAFLSRTWSHSHQDPFTDHYNR